MDLNRYSSANAAEKKSFTKFALLIALLTFAKVAHRELKGAKSRIKYIFALKANNPHIHSVEMGTRNGEIVNLRLVVSRPTLKSEFYLALMKLKAGDPQKSYGGIVVTFEASESTIEGILKDINKLGEVSDEVALNPKRTYCDPPAGWIEGNDGKVGVVKSEKKEVKVEETPETLEEVPEVSSEVSAEEQAEKDIEEEAA